jgi:hypothetical protein
MVSRNLDHPAMGPVRSWFDRHLPPNLRNIPGPLRAIAEQAAQDAFRDAASGPMPLSRKQKDEVEIA